MRLVVSSIAGLSLALGAFVVSTLDDGWLGAVCFILSLFIGAVTIGSIAASCVNRVVERGRLRAAMKPRPSDATSSTRWRSGVRCGTCGAEMVRRETIWVCAMCDLAPIDG